MKSFAKGLAAMWVGCSLLPFAARADSHSGSAEGHTFRLGFETGHPLVYAVDETTELTTDLSIPLPTGDRAVLTKKKTETRYRIKLTPLRKSESGIWTIRYQPYDFEAKVDVVNDRGHVVTSLHGLEVKATQNGIVIVDTAKKIGMAQARAFKLAVYPKMLSGYLDLSPTGSVTKIDGDLPFIDFWTEALKFRIGFFDIEFPEGPIAPGEKWKENLTLRCLNGIQFGDEGIVETNEFVRDLDSDLSSNQPVSFSSTLAVNAANLTGSLEQMGQNSLLNISEFNNDKSGKFQFDSGHNRFANVKEEQTARITADMLMQGRTASMSLDLEQKVGFKLLSDNP